MDANNRTNGNFEESGAGKIGKDRANVRIAPPFISLAGIGIGVVAHFFAVPLTVPGLWPALRIFSGVFLGLGGLAAIGFSLSHFKRTGQKPEPWTPTPAIICEGIYRYSRNPMYFGLTLIQCGIGIGTGVFWITAMVLPVMIAIYYMVIQPEENTCCTSSEKNTCDINPLSGGGSESGGQNHRSETAAQWTDPDHLGCVKCAVKHIRKEVLNG